MLVLTLASDIDLRWSQEQVTKHHYLHAPVDIRSSPLAYTICLRDGPRVGCLIFGRPEATRCYDLSSRLTYGSYEDVIAGRCEYDRWEIINLARVWLDPVIQRGGNRYVPHAASQMIAKALQRVRYDYLAIRPPVDCSRPYQLRVCLSYCDTRIHSGYLYRVCRFKLARTNHDGIATFMRRLPSLDDEQDRQIRRLSKQHPRSQRIRSERQNMAFIQPTLL